MADTYFTYERANVAVSYTVPRDGRRYGFRLMLPGWLVKTDDKVPFVVHHKYIVNGDRLMPLRPTKWVATEPHSGSSMSGTAHADKRDVIVFQTRNRLSTYSEQRIMEAVLKARATNDGMPVFHLTKGVRQFQLPPTHMMQLMED